VASHHSTALIHGRDLFPAAPGVVTFTRPPPRRCNRPRSEGIAFHIADLPDEHVTMVLGAKVTTVSRTVVDLARVSTFMSAVVTADSALRSPPHRPGACFLLLSHPASAIDAFA
jgi:hypothetical protein